MVPKVRSLCVRIDNKILTDPSAARSSLAITEIAGVALQLPMALLLAPVQCLCHRKDIR